MEQNQHNSVEINLFDYWRVIKKRKRFVMCIVAGATLLTAIISLTMPKYYKAEAVIMPIGGRGGGLAAMFGSLGGLASLAGIDAGGRTPSQQFIALLRTRTLAEEIMDKLDLMPILLGAKNKDEELKWKDTKMGAAVAALRGHVSFMDNMKNGTITISTEFKDPKISTDVANGYVEGLQELISKNSFTVTKRNRIFIEGQLAQNKRELLEAGKELNEFYKSGKVSSVKSTIDVSVESNQISNTDQAIISDVHEQVEMLRKNKEDIESKIVKGVPQQVYLQYLTLRRNLLTQINTLLTQQCEIAKIEEAKDELAFQVIDPARVPEKRSKPKRKQMVMMVFVSSLFLSVFTAFFMEYLEKIKQQIKVKGEI